MQNRVVTTQLKAPFSRGIVDNKGMHLVPEQYSTFLKNVRISNSTTTVRNGYKVISEDPLNLQTKVIRDLANNNDNVYTVLNKHLYRVNLTTGALTDVDGGTTFTNDTRTYSTKVGQYILYRDGATNGYVRNETTSIFATISTMPSGANPSFGEVFLFGTYVAGSGTNNQTLYISRGFTQTHPEYAYDFSGTGAETLYMRSPIRALRATLDRLFIFTETSIEYISRDTTTASGGVSTTFSVPIAGPNEPVNQDCVVMADDKIFFFTKDKRVKTLNYVAGISEVQVGDLTNRMNQSIEELIGTIDDDQSTAFGYYDKESKLVYFFLRQSGEPFNNVCLIYDMVYETFLYDTNKFFGCYTYLNNTYYTGSCINPEIYQDNIGKEDDGEVIPRERRTTLLSLGSPNLRKEFRGVNIFGEIDSLAEIKMQVLVDGVSQFYDTISQNGQGFAGRGAEMEGSVPLGADYPAVNKLAPFEKRITYTRLRARGKKIQLIFSGDIKGGDFCLSGLSFTYIPLGDSITSDKF